MILGLLHKVRAGPAPEPHTLAAHLLAVRDPHTEGPLPEDHIISEVAVFFVAGFETTGMPVTQVIELVNTGDWQHSAVNSVFPVHV